MRNSWLIAGATLSAVAAVLHVAIIIGGPDWYRFFGAGDKMARLAERSPLRAAVTTLAIATILAVWAAYAFSGAGVIGRLPLLRTGLVVICLIYAARAAALPIMLRHWPGGNTTFLIVSSIVVGVFALVHIVGVWSAWPELSAP